MRFDFFTFGGSVFWEDVFFYQKWRIQRNCYTKKYRLLDFWDIRRASGTFEDCQKAFIRYIDCYEIVRQRGEMIILLHGYADSKNIFKPLWRRFMRTKANVAALNYPSLVSDAQGAAHQILFFLNHIESITKVSFVTKGCGSLVLRQMFNLPTELQNFRQNMRIGNIVEINPVEKGNGLCQLLVRFKFFRFLLGPFLSDFTESRLRNLPSLPSEFNVLKIFAKPILQCFADRVLNFLSFNEEEEIKSGKNIVFVKGTYLSPLKNNQVLDLAVKFINNGKI